MKKETQLTSVKVDKQKFETFRIESVKDKFPFSKLVNAAMSLYIIDKEFKKLVNNFKD